MANCKLHSECIATADLDYVHFRSLLTHCESLSICCIKSVTSHEGSLHFAACKRYHFDTSFHTFSEIRFVTQIVADEHLGSGSDEDRFSFPLS